MYVCEIRMSSTFFKDFHLDLAETIRLSLRPHGMAHMLNPSRHGSLDRFADISTPFTYDLLDRTT